MQISMIPTEAMQRPVLGQTVTVVASTITAAIATLSFSAATAYPSIAPASSPTVASAVTALLAPPVTSATPASPSSLPPSFSPASARQLDRLASALAPSEVMGDGDQGQSEQSQPVAPSSSLPPGIYVYGQSPQRDQLGQTYLVFEVLPEAIADEEFGSGAIVGGFYMPSSSFDCFEGALEADRLALTITDSYTAETYSYGLALATSTVAAQDPQVPFGLEGFQSLDGFSETDYKVLSTCKADAGL